MMVDLHVLKRHIQHGDPDLYRGIRALCGFPVPSDVSDTFMRLAHAIVRLYPDRVNEPLTTAYDARIIAMEFCDDRRTARSDVLRVIDAA